MKRVKFMAFLMIALGTGMVVSSCDDDDDDEVVNTNEQTGETGGKEAVTATVTFEEEYWDALIDDPQYYGPLLYGENCNEYNWTDEETSLHGGMATDDAFWSGGSAISNYVDDNLKEHGTYEYQLSVPVSNGSSNFVIVYCDASGMISTSVSFADGKARQIKSMDICPNTYLLGEELYGNEFGTEPLGKDGDYFTLTITADNGKSIDIDLARDSYIMQDWTTVSLEELGKVTSLGFTMSGSDASEWGGVVYLNTPTYFAFDNVVVVME